MKISMAKQEKISFYLQLVNFLKIKNCTKFIINLKIILFKKKKFIYTVLWRLIKKENPFS
jgi:hypothetical protein